MNLLDDLIQQAREQGLLGPSKAKAELPQVAGPDWQPEVLLLHVHVTRCSNCAAEYETPMGTRLRCRDRKNASTTWENAHPTIAFPDDIPRDYFETRDTVPTCMACFHVAPTSKCIAKREVAVVHAPHSDDIVAAQRSMHKRADRSDAQNLLDTIL